MSIGLPEKEKPLKELPPLDEGGILVVDDDPAFQLGLKTFLREYAGFEKVFTAGNAEEILAIENVNGGLVGGASLKAEDFWAICRSSPP